MTQHFQKLRTCMLTSRMEWVAAMLTRLKAISCVPAHAIPVKEQGKVSEAEKKCGTFSIWFSSNARDGHCEVQFGRDVLRRGA